MLSSLREIAGRHDPVPAAVLAAARASLAWRDPDAALIELVRDSLDQQELLTVRGSRPRLLTFGGVPMVVTMGVTPRGGVVEVVGELRPAQEARVVLEWPGGSRETSADGEGRFRVDDVAPGPVRLRCEPAVPGAFVPLRTEWVQL